MSDPTAVSPVRAASSKTDTPQCRESSVPAGNPAPFRVCARPTGSELMLFGIEPESLAACDVALLGDLAHARFGLEDAKAIVNALNRVAAARRGDNPADVQRQLLEELRELVKIQRETLTRHLPIIEEAVAGMRGESARPELNVNDLMIEVARSFGLSDAASRSIGDLKGFCAAAYDMRSVPQSAERPLLILAARGVLGADKVGHARAACEALGLDIG